MLCSQVSLNIIITTINVPVILINAKDSKDIKHENLEQPIFFIVVPYIL